MDQIKYHTTKPDIVKLFKALKFSAEKHRFQKRKGSGGIPYINQPIEVTGLIIESLEKPSVELLMAAILHDTVEDTNATPEEIEHAFGKEVKDLVLEVTDDMSLSRDKRKQLQVEHAKDLSREARCIKIADKACNINDILYTRIKWSRRRKMNYVKWANEVVCQIRNTNPVLEETFDASIKKAQELLDFTL